MRFFISPNALTPLDEHLSVEQLFDILNLYKKVEYDEGIASELTRWLDDPYTLFKHPDKKEHLFRVAKVTRYLHTIPFYNVRGFSSDLGNSPDRDYLSVWSIFMNAGCVYANIHGLKRELINTRFRKHFINEILQSI